MEDLIEKEEIFLGIKKLLFNPQKIPSDSIYYRRDEPFNIRFPNLAEYDSKRLGEDSQSEIKDTQKKSEFFFEKKMEKKSGKKSEIF